jgi:predicted nucleotidyltransferase
MRIDRKETIAGVPILQVRDYLRLIDDEITNKDFVAQWLGVSSRKGGQIVRELLARGWLEPVERTGRKGYCALTMAGRAFAGARAVSPISRTKADALLVAFLERVAEVNKRDELTHYVKEVRVFGSYLDKRAKDLGDIDLAVDMPFRDLPGRDRLEYLEERADQSGRSFKFWLERMAYGENEVRRLLKTRSPYISLHPISDIKATKARSKVLFVVKSKD